MSLEGIPNIPIASVQIQEGLNTTPSCTVTLALNKFAATLIPGTIGHIYYKEKDKWVLIFEGEFAGINISKSTTAKTIGLFFVGLTNVWDHAWIQEIEFSISSTITGNYYVNMGIIKSNGEEGQADENLKKLQPLSPAATPIASVIMLLDGWVKENKASVSFTTTNLFTQLFSYIKAYNEYFARIDTTQRLHDRIYVIENRETRNLIENIAFTQFLSGETDTPNIMSAKQLVGLVCSYIGYDWVELPTPVVINGELKSIIIKPRLAFAAPIMCNAVFPTQIMDLRYDHNALKKPTRFSTKSKPILLGGELSTLIGFAPKAELVVSGGVLQRFHTSEEKLRGIYPAQEDGLQYLDQIFLDSYEAKEEEDHVIAAPVEHKPVTLSDTGKEYDSLLRRMTDKRYFELRSAATNATVMTEYTPHRLLGFPGVFLESDLPSLVGVVAGLASVITAEGSATQNISLAFCVPYVLVDDAELQKKLSKEFEEHPMMPEYYESGVFKIQSINDQYLPFGSKSIYEVLPNEKKSDSFSNRDAMVASLKHAIKLTDPYEQIERNLYTNDVSKFIGSGVINTSILNANKAWPYIRKRQEIVTYLKNSLRDAENGL